MRPGINKTKQQVLNILKLDFKVGEVILSLCIRCMHVMHKMLSKLITHLDPSKKNTATIDFNNTISCWGVEATIKRSFRVTKLL